MGLDRAARLATRALLSREGKTEAAQKRAGQRDIPHTPSASTVQSGPVSGGFPGSGWPPPLVGGGPPRPRPGLLLCWEVSCCPSHAGGCWAGLAFLAPLPWGF